MAEDSIILNRLRKNQKRLKSYLKQIKTEAYRLYDKDIPEYPYIVDLYGMNAVIYEKGKRQQEGDFEQLRKLHQSDIESALKTIHPDWNLIWKVRESKKGLNQYEKIAKQNKFIQVKEGSLDFYVNLYDYLDTGLFLDHRPLRQKLLKIAKTKKVLNLFCYTGSLSVAAAKGGGSTTSVDLSNTYLNWAKDNFNLNSIDWAEHDFIQADVFQWLESHQDLYDIIIIDPPSFSNSKRMEDTLDIQRDHVQLLLALFPLLKENGVIYFSNNLRDFKLDQSLHGKFAIKNITKESIPPDFKDQKIHHAFKLNKKSL